MTNKAETCIETSSCRFKLELNLNAVETKETVDLQGKFC